MADISDAVRAKVTSRMGSAPLLDLVSSVEDFESEEEDVTVYKKSGLKSSKPLLT